MEKKCFRCNAYKDISSFSKSKKTPDKLHSWCKECVKDYDHNRHINKRYTILLQKKEYRESRRFWLKEYKKGKVCLRCGESHPACLVFHHKDDTIKENNIADMIRGGYSLKNIKKELDKCEVLCSNCHNKEHFSKDYL
jgi:hypothetical protein